ncbi:type IV pilus twitching motility protein PilT [Calditrichota bacterium GD2]
MAVNFDQILRFAVRQNASDIHFSSGMQPIVRLVGELKRIDAPVITYEDLRNFIFAYLRPEQRAAFEKNLEIDFSLSIEGISRFRVNVFKHSNGLSASFRIIPEQIRTLNELLMPPVLKEIVRHRKGLILVTGPTGSGKSTTLAAMIDEINRNRRDHIITLEDPIEYLHRPKLSLIHQREVGVHTQSFAQGLRAALREDPDVILVGEMRDIETITNALHAAETGHLVFSTLHTNSASETVDRIINVFPGEQQQQIRVILAGALVAVISQRLVRQAHRTDRIALLEILIATPAIRNLIREGKTHQIESAIQMGAEFGMRTFQKSLDELRQRNLVPPDMIKVDFAN